MRIALLSPEPPGQGGIGSYTATVARGLAERGHHVWVLLPGQPRERLDADGVHWRSLGELRADRLPAFNGTWGLSLGWLPWARMAARALRELHARVELDVAEIPEWMAGALFMAPSRGVPPLVVRLHTHLALVRRLNELPMTADERLASWLEGQALRRADALLANSHALARQASQDHGLAPGRVAVLPLGVELDRYDPEPDPTLRRSLGLDERAIIALFAGRIERRKGIDTLVAAFRQAASRSPRLHLAIAGSDTRTGEAHSSLQEALTSHLSRHGLTHRVHWLGPQPSAAMPGLYAGCDFLAAPSRLEPFGLVYLEAMASAKPVVGCHSGGVPEIVSSGEHGLLVAPDDPDALAGALLALAEDPDRRARMGLAARRRVEADFDHRRLAAATAAWYRQVADLPAQRRIA